MANLTITPELKAKVNKYKKQVKDIEGRGLSDEQALTEIIKGQKVNVEFHQKIENDL